ncbi:hypothetical protein F5Y17DRAFT_286457 [Xylariaceae sp. FL0594]|nr:hypothetical protein F5Y17DRAFT_286457 [Xylariaceae sp. FL0594]
MPKKRHQPRYSKPPSVPPASLSLSSSSRSTPDQRHESSVNQLLANLRRTTLSPTQTASTSVSDITAPSVPPTLRRLLQIPETPAPPPRRPQRRDLFGRRLPPGPPPPRSWVFNTGRAAAPSTKTPSRVGQNESRPRRWPLPGVSAPGERSLVDLVLRHIAFGWEQQRDWNRFYLYTLPSRLRSALLSRISELYPGGVSVANLRLLLAGPSADELAEYEVAPPDVHKLNSDFFSLDLNGSIGRSLSVKELRELLFGPTRKMKQKNTASDRDVDADSILDSWDAPAPMAPPVGLLPNLTHLSLAIDPGSTSLVSWKQLLALAAKLPQLTELSLAGWPAPALTPNARLAHATVHSPTGGRIVEYSGTGAYSHTLDDDWTEAILVLRRLSRSLYGLEYLDLTGCGDWAPALERTTDAAGDEDGDGEFKADFVDWAGDWGKVRTLRLTSGYEVTAKSVGDEGVAISSCSPGEALRMADWIDAATAVERRIRAQRAGRGRGITVERDTLSDAARRMVEMYRETRNTSSLVW